jgi:hypothetical protein
MEKLSGSFMVLIQGIVMVFCLPFLILICYLYTSKDMETPGYIFLTVISIIIFVLLKQVMSYADIYLAHDYLVIKKLFITRKVPILEIKLIDEGILPFVYYIEFENNKTVYFQLKPKDIFNQIKSSDLSYILNFLKEKIKLQPPNEDKNNSISPDL